MITWLLVRIKPVDVMMNPEPAPEDPEKIEPFESVVSIVTTDGLTRLATRTMASDCVNVIC